MKNKFLQILFLLIISSNVVIADSWDDFSNIDRMWDGQKSITNKEFEEVIDKLEEKGKLKEQKQIKKKRKKLFGSGTTLHEELNPDSSIQELESLKPEDEDLILNSPVKLIIDKKILDKGYYKVLPETDKENNKKYICLYQSQFLKGKIEVIETQNDFDEENLNFVRLIPYNENFVKIIFGSLEFNAYVFVPFVN